VPVAVVPELPERGMSGVRDWRQSAPALRRHSTVCRGRPGSGAGSGWAVAVAGPARPGGGEGG